MWRYLVLTSMVLGAEALEVDITGAGTKTTTPPPRWSSQPSNATTCEDGVCGAGKWVAYYGGKTEDECKAICDSTRQLVEEPKGCKEFVSRFVHHGRWRTATDAELVRNKKFERTVPNVDYWKHPSWDYWDAEYRKYDV